MSKAVYHADTQETVDKLRLPSCYLNSARRVLSINFKQSAVKHRVSNAIRNVVLNRAIQQFPTFHPRRIESISDALLAYPRRRIRKTTFPVELIRNCRLRLPLWSYESFQFLFVDAASSRLTEMKQDVPCVFCLGRGFRKKSLIVSLISLRASLIFSQKSPQKKKKV